MLEQNNDQAEQAENKTDRKCLVFLECFEAEALKSLQCKPGEEYHPGYGCDGQFVSDIFAAKIVR